MIHLPLTNEETQILSNVIECCITELRGEIKHTDSYEFKNELKQRRELLANLLQKVRTFDVIPAAAD
jgi:hypothetical protein